MSLADTVRAMAAAGCSAEQIAAAVEHIDGQRLAKVRAGNAERQRRWRETNQSNANNDVTQRDAALSDVTERDERYASRAPVEVLPLPTEVGKKENKKEGANGRTLPADWQPSLSHFNMAAVKGRTRSWVVELGDTMREWAEANRNRAIARKADWDKTFNGWLRREFEKNPVRGPPANGQPRFRNGAAALLAKEFEREHPTEFASWTDRNRGASANGAGPRPGSDAGNGGPDVFRHEIDLMPLRSDAGSEGSPRTSQAGVDPIPPTGRAQ